jgi:hypothetical protein
MKEDWLGDLLDSLRKEEQKIKQGGGPKRIEKSTKKGR